MLVYFFGFFPLYGIVTILETARLVCFLDSGRRLDFYILSQGGPFFFHECHRNPDIGELLNCNNGVIAAPQKYYNFKLLPTTFPITLEQMSNTLPLTD